MHNNRAASHAIILLTVTITVALFTVFYRAAMAIAVAIGNNRKYK